MPKSLDPDDLGRRLARARDRRSRWLSLWRDAYDVALPQRGGPIGDGGGDGASRTAEIFDGTAPDAVDQLAASLLAQLTPPWSRWIGFTPGPALSKQDGAAIAPDLEAMAETLHAHLDRGNFAMEMHQCFLDLIVGGTACLLVEGTAPGDLSALRFTAVPLGQFMAEEGGGGRLDTVFREVPLTHASLTARFGDIDLPTSLKRQISNDPQTRLPVIEAAYPDALGYRYAAMLAPDGEAAHLLADGRYSEPPFIAFRWMKAPGESYGRSPVMKALPDIRTANKVVELTLKNASIAVAGLWQADDDGVINPANITLEPGAIIPKAVGSSGLQPLQPADQFDISQLVLDDLRRRIRHALMVDRLGQIDAPRMTATEVLERSAEMARLLGATYGRLQSELLVPLVQRCLAILRRRGEIPDLPVDGRAVTLTFRAPLSQAQSQRDVQSTLIWLERALALGPEGAAVIDRAAAVRWLGERLGVPAPLIRSEAETGLVQGLGALADLAGAAPD